MHKNICKYTNRNVETSAELHDEWLVDIWNSQVNPGDTVYSLGDFSFGKYTEVEKFTSRLNGQKILIKGNHCNREHLQKLKQANLIANWHDYKEVKVEDTTACLFHFPIGSWHKQTYGSWQLHGHSHGAYKDTRGKQLDVGLDSAYDIFRKHRLFSVEDIKEIMHYKEVYVADEHRQQR